MGGTLLGDEAGELATLEMGDQSPLAFGVFKVPQTVEPAAGQLAAGE